MRQMPAEEFVRRLKASSDVPDTRFAFFIGSGCSRSSGIPTSGELVKQHWLPRIRSLCAPETEDADIDEWAASQINGYDPDNPAASYGAVIEKLFLTPGERQVEIERLCDGRFPRFGYATLASLIARNDGSFNVTLTTNFDDLIADALYLFTQSRPLVIQHESLSDYIRPTRTRPLVVKLHGDHRLSPLNTAQETMQLKESINSAVKALLQDRGLVFLGYGGADQGILTMLDELNEDALPFGVFWVSRTEPVGKTGEWIEKRNGTWVQHNDFDKLTMLMRSEFDLPAPDEKRFNAVFARYTDDYTKLTNEISLLTDETPGTLALKEAARRTDETFEGPWAVLLEARRLRNSDPDQAMLVYERGIDLYPDFVPLVAELAAFLSTRDPAAAEKLHQSALRLSPDDPVVLSNYATFLSEQDGDLGLAEELYLRAIEIAPNLPNPVAAYGAFLWTKRRDAELAEKYFSRALDIDPYNPSVLGTYANMNAQQREVARAEILYLRALTIDPKNAHNLANFAGLLLAVGDRQLGMEMLSRAFTALPLADDMRLHVELWFYKYVHGPEDARSSALRELRRLLEQGYRSPGWDLSRNVERACADEHPECEWLGPLAQVIAENANIAGLESWPAWQSAGDGNSTG